MEKSAYEIKRHDKSDKSLKENTEIISTLASEIWREHYITIITADQIEYMLKTFQSANRILSDINDDNYIYFTAVNLVNEQPVGYCGCKIESDHILLSKLYIKKSERGKGLSRLFLETAVKPLTREFSLNKIHLNVNKNNDTSIAIYKKMGFEIIKSVNTDIGGGFSMDDYIMQLIV